MPSKYNTVIKVHNQIGDILELDGLKVELYDGEKVFKKYNKYYSEKDGKVRQVEQDFYNYLFSKLNKFDYWEMEDGTIMELGQMSESHLKNTIGMLEEKGIDPDDIISKMKVVLRDKTIDNVLNDPTEKNYGLDI